MTIFWYIYDIGDAKSASIKSNLSPTNSIFDIHLVTYVFRQYHVTSEPLLALLVKIKTKMTLNNCENREFSSLEPY